MTIRKVFGAVALMGLMASANAASISLAYTGGNATDTDGAIIVANGDMVTFDVVVDFSDAPTLGGGFDIVFDSSVLQFGDYNYIVYGDAAFGRPPDVMDGLLESAAFGDFAGLSGAGVVVGQVSFTVAGLFGDTMVNTGPTNGIGGPFISAIDFVSEIPVNYGGATLRAIPVPAAVWFMLSGLGALIGFGRKSA